jgi:hypothetical protein
MAFMGVPISFYVRCALERTGLLIRKNSMRGDQSVAIPVRKSLGNGFDVEATIFGDKAFYPFSVVTEEDEVFCTTHNDRGPSVALICAQLRGHLSAVKQLRSLLSVWAFLIPP